MKKKTTKPIAYAAKPIAYAYFYSYHSPQYQGANFGCADVSEGR